MDDTPREVHLVVHQHGVTIPSWLAISMIAAFVLACLTFLLTISELRAMRADSDELRREIRMLQLHSQDIENVLIRAGAAQRTDFAPWPNDKKEK